MKAPRRLGLCFRFLSSLCLCASVVSSAGCGSTKEPDAAPQPAGGGAEQPVRVKVIRPTREHLQRVSTPQPARVEPYEKTDIHAKVSGYLDMIGPALAPDGQPILDKDQKPRPLDIGDRVTKGQMLAKLWVPEMEKELELKKALHKQAQADVKKYDAERVFREAELARLEKMVKGKSIEEAVLDEKRLQRDAVQAAIASAQARVQVALRETELVEALLNYATIRAPFTGLLTRRLVDTGTFVQSAASARAEPLFTLARVDRLRIVADIPEAEAGLVWIGQPAGFQPTASRGQPLSGKVVRFADALDPGSRTMRVEVELDTPANLRPGMFGSATIVLIDIPDALTLPASAVAAGTKPYVLSVEGGRVEQRDVEIGYNDGVRVQITSGLRADGQVIPDARASLRKGQAVEVAE